MHDAGPKLERARKWASGVLNRGLLAAHLRRCNHVRILQADREPDLLPCARHQESLVCACAACTTNLTHQFVRE